MCEKSHVCARVSFIYIYIYTFTQCIKRIIIILFVLFNYVTLPDWRVDTADYYC